MEFVADSVGPGAHDLLAGMCSERSTRLKFGIADAHPRTTSGRPWRRSASG